MRELSNFGPLIGLIAVIGIFSIPIVAIIGHFIQSTIKAWTEVGLKRDMVARGYTAQEIFAVIAAERSAEDYKRDMVAEGYSAEDICAVIAAERGAENKSPLPNIPPAKPIKQPAYS